MITTAWYEIRAALRSLSHSSGFLIIGTLSLALGVGVNTSVFRIAQAVLFPPEPGHDIEELVTLYHRDAEDGRLRSISFPDYEAYRDNADVFADLAAFIRRPVRVEIDGRTSEAMLELATGNYFSMLGVTPILGQPISPEDDHRQAPNNVVISERFWRTRFNADRQVIGRVIHISESPFEIVGVAPDSFRGTLIDWFGKDPELWVAASKFDATAPGVAARGVDFLAMRRGASFVVTGRLRPGATLAEADAQVATLRHSIESEYSNAFQGLGTQVYPLSRTRFWPGHRDKIETQLIVLISVVGLILLIACLNLAGLLLSRLEARRRDLAVKVALGAGRARLAARQLTEAALLAVAAGVLSVAFAHWTTQYFLSFPKLFIIPMALEAGWDWRSGAFAALVSIATVGVFGAIPALRLRSVNLNDVLKSSGRSSAGGRQGLWKGLMVGQVALSTAMLIAAGLLVTSLINSRARAKVHDPAHILSARLNLGHPSFTPESSWALQSRLLAELRQSREVVEAGFTNRQPLSIMRPGERILIDGERANVHRITVTPGYFDTVGFQMLSGRAFGASDTADSMRVAIVNEELARRLGIGGPGGQVLFEKTDTQPLEIVGIVQDGDASRAQSEPTATLYRSGAQFPTVTTVLNVRFRGGFAPIERILRKNLERLSSVAFVSDIRTLDSEIDRALSQERASTILLSALSGLALLLAVLGIFSVVSYSVTRRTREFAIRKAVGAPLSAIIGGSLGGGVRLAAIGAALGLAIAAAAGRALESVLFGVDATDPTIFAAGALALIIAATIAAAAPTHRAVSISPAEALRQD